MKITLHIVVLTTCLFLYSKSNLTQLNWTDVLPYFNILCETTSSCDEFYNADREGQSRVKNPCCKGCECKAECTDNSRRENMERYAECIHPMMRYTHPKLIKYKYVVDAPEEGCVKKTWLDDLPHSCSPDDIVAPWGNFYPVYSHEKQISFKNANCARCHGANNTVKWKTYILYFGRQGYENMVKIHQTYKSKYVNVLFKAPNRESQSYGNVCFNEKDVCNPADAVTFYIPSNINMSRQQIVQACEKGPRSLYLGNIHTSFKNVFCALCNKYMSGDYDSLRCEYKNNDGGSRGAGQSLALLLNDDYVDSKIQEFTKKDTLPLACQPSNDNSRHVCREVFCPTLQTRYSDGKCRYPMTEFYADILYLYLNLVSSEVVKELRTANRTSAEALSLFERFSPWQRDWTIISIGVRVDKGVVNRTEAFVQLKLQTNMGVDPGKLVQGVLYTMSKPWILDVGVKIPFDQHICSHEGMVIDRNIASPTYGKRIPRWAETFYEYSNDTDFVMPVWDVSYYDFIRDFDGARESSTITLSKLLFCNQVELQASEFEIKPHKSPAYLHGQDRYLFLNEYYRYTRENGSQSITVCIEDSGLVLIGSQNSSPSMNFDTCLTLGMLIIIYRSGLYQL